MKKLFGLRHNHVIIVRKVNNKPQNTEEFDKTF
jgi:hypothetical protein